MSPTRWVRNPEVLWREVADGVVLLPPGTDEPFALTDSGAAVWDLLATPVDIDTAVTQLATAYQVAPEVVGASVGPLLDDLRRRDAVRQVR